MMLNKYFTDPADLEEYQRYELLAFLGDNPEDDYDVAAIEYAVTVTDYQTGKRYWDEFIDTDKLNRIAEEYRI